MRLLVVEDELSLARAIRYSFSQVGFVVDVTHYLADAIARAESMAYDCIVMDVMLPDGNGIQGVAELRQAGCNTPILVLTVQNDPSDRVRGLNAGADDYLGKPFHREELLARVGSLVRRATSTPHLERIEWGAAVLHCNSRTLEVGNHIVELSSKEFLLLEYLFRHPKQIITREQLVAHVWGPDTIVADNALDTYIYFLRKKAAQIGFKSLIKTVRSQGYTLGSAS